MILQAILDLVFALISMIIDLVPSVPAVQVSFNGILQLMKYGLFFFGSTTFALILGNVMLWAVIDMSWAVIEWTYRKIPGVS